MRVEKNPFFLQKYYFAKRYDCSFRKLARRTVTEEKFLLDAGCGKRTVIGEEGLRPKSTIGTEFALEDLRMNSGVDHKVVATVDNLPFKSGIFDMVICRNVVEHLEKPLPAFSEFHRVLKTKGLVLIRTPNLTNPIAFISAVLPLSVRTWVKRHLFHDHEGDTFPTYFNCNTGDKMRKTFESLGFSTTLITYDGLVAYFNFSTIILSGIVLFERITETPKLRWLKMWIISSFQKS